MALFSSVFRQLFERFAHFLLRRETPPRAQQCAAQELAAEKLPEQCEAFDYTANDRKRRKRRRKVPEKYPLGERQEEEREVKINKGGSHKDEAEITLSLEKKRGCVHQKKREMHSLEKLMEGGSELREAGEKKRKKRKRKKRKLTEPTPLLVEVKPEQCEAFDYTANDRKRRKRRRKVPEKYPLGERQEEEREVKINKGGSHKDEAEITLSLEMKRGCVHQKKREMHSLEKLMEGGSELREAGEKKRKKRKRKKRKLTEPTPLLVEVKPLHTTVRSSFLKPIEGELPMLPSVSGHLALPAAHFKPVHHQKPDPAPEIVLSPSCSPLQVDRNKLLAVPLCPVEVDSFRCSSSHVLPLVVPPRPTPAPDELFSIRHSSSQVRHPKRLPSSPTPAPDEVVALQRPPSQKPQLFTSSLFEPPPQLMLIDMEDEENEYVEYTGKTIRASDSAWASEVVEVQAFEEEEGNRSEMGDTKAIQDHSDDASQIDELPMKLFCVASPDGPKNETQHNVNVQTKCKRKWPLVLLTWAEEKAKKKQEKKIIKEKERREKELLLERYMNDPKLKHLWINKHNLNYNSS